MPSPGAPPPNPPPPPPGPLLDTPKETTHSFLPGPLDLVKFEHEADVFLIGALKATATGVLGVLGVGVGLFVGALTSSTSALEKFAKDVLSISDATNASVGQSQNLVNDFRAVGVSSDQTAQIFGSREMNPDLFNQRSRAVGAPDLSDPNFLVKEAKWYQSGAKDGTGGFLARRAQLDAQFGGNAPDSILRLANTRPETLQANLNYGRDVQSSLGVGPNAIKKAGEDIDLLENRIGVFVAAAKERFATDLLPGLEAGFSVASEIFLKNADSIGAGLSSAAKWIVVDLPGYIIDGGRIVLAAGKGIADTFFDIGDAGVALLRSLGNHEGGLYAVLAFAARAIDSIAGLGGKFAGAIVWVQAALNNAIADDPILQPALKTVGLEFEHIDQHKAYDDTVKESSFNGGSALDSLNGLLDKGKLNGYADKAQGLLNRGRKFSNDEFGAASQTWDYVEKRFGTKEERENTYWKAMAENQKAQLDVAKQMLGEMQNNGSGPAMSSSQILDILTGAIAGEAYRVTTR